MSVSMSDHHVVLLEKVVEENKALREQVTAIVGKDKTALEDLHKKIDCLKTTSVASKRVRQTGPSTMHVPKMCRNDVRRKLKLLEKAGGDGFLNLNESLESEHNLRVFHAVSNELSHEYGGDGKCPWTLLHLKGAFKTYLKSRKVQLKRTQNGTNAVHLAKCRRQARKRDKLGKRVGSLANKNWSVEKKAKVAEVMTVDYMSSEDSDHDPEPPNRVTQYIVRPLCWQSNELKRTKKRLDKKHSESVPELIRKRTLPRNIGVPSARGKPENCPEWACTSTQSDTSLLSSPSASPSPLSALQTSTPLSARSSSSSSSERSYSPSSV